MTSSPEIDDVRWLVSEAAQPWLSDCASLPSTVALARRLQKSIGPTRAALVLQIAALRERAKEKFAAAGQLYFTAKGLEQASGEGIAHYKAGRFPSQTPLADLCCGIGGDLLALARGGMAWGVEIDEIVALFAEANCRTLGIATGSSTSTSVHVADAATWDVAGCGAWHIDPDRRATGRRTTRVEQYQPDLAALERLRAANPNAAVKLAPACAAPESWREGVELEWIGQGGECRQQVAWSGSLALRPGNRCATIVSRDGDVLRTIAATHAQSQTDFAPPAAHVGRYVCEPHAAVFAAQLVGPLAAEHGLLPLGARSGYLTGDARPVFDAALSAFEVQDVLPFDVKRLKRHLRERGIGRLEVKKRGVDVDPQRVRRQLQVEGDVSATLLLAPLAGRVQAIVARRLTGE